MGNERPAGKFVTIVSGLPRSGTSMMMQMLAVGGLSALTDSIREADEDNPRGYYEFEVVKQGSDTSWLADAEGKVVKMVYRLLYGLPPDCNYRVVFMQRDLREVIASQEVMLERQGKAGEKVDDDKLETLFRRQLKEVEEWLRDQPNFSVLYVDYHDALKSSARVVDQLNDFLGGGLNTETMRQVPDSALHRQRSDQPSAS